PHPPRGPVSVNQGSTSAASPPLSSLGCPTGVYDILGGMERMGDPKLAPAERYTYRQYRTWPDTERWELIEGRAWTMSPAPKSRHQALVWRLSSLLYDFLKGT